MHNTITKIWLEQSLGKTAICADFSNHRSYQVVIPYPGRPDQIALALVNLAKIIARDPLLVPETRRKCPWPDFSGNAIFEGDKIQHTSGESGEVIFYEAGESPQDQWFVDYKDGGARSRLCLQIGEKGRAISVGRWVDDAV